MEFRHCPPWQFTLSILQRSSKNVCDSIKEQKRWFFCKPIRRPTIGLSLWRFFFDVPDCCSNFEFESYNLHPGDSNLNLSQVSLILHRLQHSASVSTLGTLSSSLLALMLPMPVEWVKGEMFRLQGFVTNISCNIGSLFVLISLTLKTRSQSEI